MLMSSFFLGCNARVQKGKRRWNRGKWMQGGHYLPELQKNYKELTPQKQDGAILFHCFEKENKVYLPTLCSLLSLTAKFTTRGSTWCLAVLHVPSRLQPVGNFPSPGSIWVSRELCWCCSAQHCMLHEDHSESWFPQKRQAQDTVEEATARFATARTVEAKTRSNKQSIRDASNDTHIYKTYWREKNSWNELSIYMSQTQIGPWATWR